MLLSYRHRRSPFISADSLPMAALARRVGMLLLILVILFYLGSRVLRLFGVGNAVHRTAAALAVEARGAVNVALDQGQAQRAEDGMSVFEGDRVQTGNAAHAMLSFFDGSIVRLDGQTDLRVTGNAQGTEQSTLSLELLQGRIWIRVPEKERITGVIARTIMMPQLRLTLPPGTEALVAASSIAVYAAEGAGLTVVPLAGSAAPIILGEGQTLVLPEGADIGSDLYAYRSPLTPDTAAMTFVAESRKKNSPGGLAASATASGAVRSGAPALPLSTLPTPVITSPVATGQTYTTSKTEIIIRGRASSGAEKIVVNDYALQFRNPAKGTWSYVARENLGNLHAGTNIFTVTAVDAGGLATAPASITIIVGDASQRSAQGSSSPIHASALPRNAPLTPGILKITAPSQDNPYIVNSGTGFLLEGLTSAVTASIWVNDYRLQLYRPGVVTWNYIVSTAIKTLKRGTNVFTIVARNAKEEILDAMTYTVEYEP